MLMIANRGPAIVVITLWFWGGGNQSAFRFCKILRMPSMSVSLPSTEHESRDNVTLFC
jgi:hypothetical protein